MIRRKYRNYRDALARHLPAGRVVPYAAPLIDAGEPPKLLICPRCNTMEPHYVCDPIDADPVSNICIPPSGDMGHY